MRFDLPGGQVVSVNPASVAAVHFRLGAARPARAGGEALPVTAASTPADEAWPATDAQLRGATALTFDLMDLFVPGRRVHLYLSGSAQDAPTLVATPTAAAAAFDDALFVRFRTEDDPAGRWIVNLTRCARVTGE